MAFHIGQLVTVKGEPGVIKYVGTTEFAPGIWYGIELDRSVGKNDGSVGGVVYFRCSKTGNYGIFVRQGLLVPISTKLQNGTDVVLLGRLRDEVTNGSISTRLSSTNSNVIDSENEFQPRANAHGDTFKSQLSAMTNSSNALSKSNDVSKLHVIIDKLQSKLKNATDDIRNYQKNLSELEQVNESNHEKVNNLKSQLEQVSIDRDFLSECQEQMQSKLEQLQVKYDDLMYDYQILQEEAELNKQIELEVKDHLGKSDSSEIKLILARNEQLELALVNLQELMASNELNLKHEISALKDQLKTKDELESEYAQVSNKLTSANNAIVLLQAQLDSTLESEKLIEHFTIENERLAEEVQNLTRTINELNELHELDKSLEENQQLVEEQLRLNIKRLEDMIKSDKETIETLEKKNRYMESTINLIKSKDDQAKLKLDEMLGHLDDRDLVSEIEKFKASSTVNSINHELAESRLEVLLEKINLLPSKSPMFNPIINVIFQLKLCEKYLNIIQNNLNNQDLELISFEYKKLQSYMKMLQSLCEFNFEEDEFSDNDFIEMVEVVCAYLLETIDKIKNNSVFGFDLLPIKSFMDAIANHFGQFDGDYVCKTKILGKLALQLINWETHSYGAIVNKIKNHLCDNKAEKELNNKLEEVEKVISLVERDISQKLKLLEDNDNLLYDCKVNIGTLANARDYSYTIITKLWENSFSNEVLDISVLLAEDGICLLEGILDVMNSFMKYTSFSLKAVNNDDQTNFKTLFVENEIETIPQDYYELQNKVDELKGQLLSKQEKIQHYELHVKLLESNLKNIDDQRLNQLSELQTQIQEAKTLHENDKIIIENLMKKNELLQHELNDVLKSKSIFDKKSFEDLDSEKKNIGKLAIVEEIVNLRKMVSINFDKGKSLKDDFTWLKKSLTDHPVLKPAKGISNFKLSAKIIRELGHDAKGVKIQDKKTWQPRSQSSKYFNLQLEERLSKYKAQQVHCFNKGQV